MPLDVVRQRSVEIFGYPQTCHEADLAPFAQVALLAGHPLPLRLLERCVGAKDIQSRSARMAAIGRNLPTATIGLSARRQFGIL